MNHSFNVEVAQRYGIEEAILLENLFWWCEKNRANGKHYIQGKYWTYNSAKAFAELFPYMSPAKIRRTLVGMEEKGLIISDNFNENKYDQTKWYALTDMANAFYRNVKSESQNCEMNITDIKPNINECKKERKEQTYDHILNEKKIEGRKRDAVIEFIKMRKLIKKPLTDRALELALMKLDKLDGTESGQIEILEQSIINGWQDLYPLRKSEQKKDKPVGKVAHKSEEYDEGFDENGNFIY